MARYKVKVDEMGEWMAQYARTHGVANCEIHHKPGCATERNTVADLDRLVYRLGDGAVIDELPTCDCGEVEIEIHE